MVKPVKKAIFPVGGLGTRFLPATKSIPKEMLPVASKPLIQYAFEEAVQAGVEQFIFVAGRNKESIVNHFDYEYELQSILKRDEKKEVLEQVIGWLPPTEQITFIRQRVPKGLGHAVWCARNVIGDEPFAVLLPDEMFLAKHGLLAQMTDAYQQTGGSVVAVAEVAKEDTNKYGIVDPGEAVDQSSMKIKGMVEKPKPEDAPSNLSITGRYILQPEIFSYLEGQKKGSGGEIQLTDAMQTMAQESPFFAYQYTGRRYDCGSKVGFLDANIAYALERADMADGVRAVLQKYNESN